MSPRDKVETCRASYASARTLHDRVVHGHDLASALISCYEADTAETDALVEAERLLEETAARAEDLAVVYRAAAGPESADPFVACVQNTFGQLYGYRFEATGDVAYLYRRLEHAHRAAALPVERQALYLANLAEAHLRLYDLKPERQRLLSATKVAKRGAAAAGPDRRACLTGAAVAYRQLFDVHGDPADLEEAEVLLRRACAEPATDDADYAVTLNELATVLQMRCAREHRPDALDEALSLQQRSAEIFPARHRNRWVVLQGLGHAFRMHHRYFQDGSAIHAAEAAYREALGLASNSSARSMVVHDLARCLQERADRFNDPSAGREAERLVRAELATMPTTDPRRAGLERLLALGSGKPEDLDALRATRARSAPDGVEWLRTSLTIGHRLLQRARSARPTEELLTEAETVLRACLPALRRGHRHLLASACIPLGQVLYLRAGMLAEARGTLSGDPAGEPVTRLPVEEATALFREAIRTSGEDLALRLLALKLLGLAEMWLRRWPQALAAYEEIIELQPFLAPSSMRRADREEVLTKFSAAIGDGPGCALEMCDPVRALAMIEQSRGFLLGEALGILDGDEELRRRAPRMREEYLRLRARLGSVGTAGREPHWFESDEPARELAVYRRIIAELRALVERMRKVPGLERFLLPPRVEDLLDGLADRRVVVVNVGVRRTDALFVHRGRIQVIPLDLTEATVRAKMTEWTAVVAAATAGTPAERKAADAAMAGLQEWMWEAITGPVFEAIGPALGVRPRLWWCLTGVLNGLPLHTATSRREGPHAQRTVTDYVVSSYTPTINALVRAARRAEGRQPGRGILAVSLPLTPGLTELAGAEEEAETAAAEAGQKALVLSGPQATRERVLRRLAEHSWFHFAGHAEQVPGSENAAHLYTYDHQDTGPVTFHDLLSVTHRGTAELGFLSACETAAGRADLPDEAIHLSGALQTTGFLHVVATFWPVRSHRAASVSRVFYRSLSRHLRSDAPRDDAFALSLHEALIEQRRISPSRPSWWSAFHHTGP